MINNNKLWNILHASLGPFDHPVVTQLKLENPSDEKILFKIKTTAPKRYCVRPNFGAVLPNDSVSVESEYDL